METKIVNYVIPKRVSPPVAPSKPKRRKRRLILAFVADIALAGVILCTFALFHHVLPQSYSPVLPPAETPADPPTGNLTPMEQVFEEQFNVTPEATENSYKSRNISLTVTTHTKGEGNQKITYYVADIYVRSVEQFRTALAKDTFGRGINDDIQNISRNNGAILAISGDNYGLNNGIVIRNGVLYRKKAGAADLCVLYKDGTIKTFGGREFDAEAELQNGAWQAWSFGPSLLSDEGSAISSFSGHLSYKHPRCALGYYEPGHYAFVLVDGRQNNYSAGMTLEELSLLFEEMGCAAAYNLDGGQTAQMTLNHELVNRPYNGGRNVSDIIYIGEVQ